MSDLVLKLTGPSNVCSVICYWDRDQIRYISYMLEASAVSRAAPIVTSRGVP